MTFFTTVNRVPLHTKSNINDRIAKQTERNIQYYANHLEEISVRLEELDKEWDIERTVESNVSAVTIVSVLLGALLSRKWFFIPGVVGGFLLQHVLQGWRPPLPLYRHFGVRTQTEIECERYALKALRGDFNDSNIANNNLDSTQAGRTALDAVNIP